MASRSKAIPAKPVVTMTMGTEAILALRLSLLITKKAAISKARIAPSSGKLVRSRNSK